MVSLNIKARCTIIDNYINYVKEAIENKNNFDEKVYNDYIEKMEIDLKRKVEKLKELSTNKKLINKYDKLVKELFN